MTRTGTILTTLAFLFAPPLFAQDVNPQTAENEILSEEFQGPILPEGLELFSVEELEADPGLQPMARYTCYARNLRRQVYRGSGWNVRQAQNDAMRRCQRYSRICYSAGCETRRGGGRWDDDRRGGDDRGRWDGDRGRRDDDRRGRDDRGRRRGPGRN